MKTFEHWMVILLLGLLCNGLGIYLHRLGAEKLAILLVILGIINVATAMWIHHKSTPIEK
ncbi:hypothetical protein N9023_03645 [Opitutaceae bacterium]|nr:hypothetical protein [Opitutaceae bacterium]MDB4474075.1 hypothetical protein [Opitutaceae bacterium]